jgi:hypothetical protein
MKNPKTILTLATTILARVPIMIPMVVMPPPFQWYPPLKAKGPYYLDIVVLRNLALKMRFFTILPFLNSPFVTLLARQFNINSLRYFPQKS